MRRAADGASFAITFLTVVPLGTRDGRGAAAAPAWFGLVGLLIGALAATLYSLAEPRAGTTVAAVLGVAALVGLTGALHHDGLADCADGIGVRGNRARRLEVMREPTIGTYGALALILWALLLVASLASLAPREAAWTLVCAAGAGRVAALLHGRWAPPARPDGLGASFAPSWPAVLIAGATAVAPAVLAFEALSAGMVLAAALAAAGVSVWARRTLGGRTGDTLGATVVLAELAAVLVVAGSTQPA